MNYYVGLFGVWVFSFSCVSNAAEMTERSDSQLLKSYAVSQCIARGYPRTPIAEDAKAASGGYLEFGRVPVDMYGDAIALAEKALKLTYQSKSGKELQIMKCIDLIFDPALDALSQRAVQ
jgi:hypothetical protein